MTDRREQPAPSAAGIRPAWLNRWRGALLAVAALLCASTVAQVADPAPPQTYCYSRIGAGPFCSPTLGQAEAVMRADPFFEGAGDVVEHFNTALIPSSTLWLQYAARPRAALRRRHRPVLQLFPRLRPRHRPLRPVRPHRPGRWPRHLRLRQRLAAGLQRSGRPDRATSHTGRRHPLRVAQAGHQPHRARRHAGDAPGAGAAGEAGAESEGRTKGRATKRLESTGMFGHRQKTGFAHFR